jgi:hypothetical protein
MAHTPEQRDKHQLCGAKKKDGSGFCRCFAGSGTLHKGYGRCKFHGGSTPSHKKNAAILEAQKRMIQLGSAIELPPHEALLAMLYLASGHVAFLRTEIASLEELTEYDGPALLTLYGEERDRVARIAKACLDVGIAERSVRVAEQFGEQLATILGRLFEDADLALTPSQRDRLPDLLRRHLVPIESNGPAAVLGAPARVGR